MTEKETKKTTVKKANSLKGKLEERIYLEYNGQLDLTEIMNQAKNSFKQLYPSETIKSIRVYVNISELMVYYVANERAEDDFKFSIE